MNLSTAVCLVFPTGHRPGAQHREDVKGTGGSKSSAASEGPRLGSLSPVPGQLLAAEHVPWSNTLEDHGGARWPLNQCELSPGHLYTGHLHCV